MKTEMKIEKNPFSFQKLEENLARLEKIYGKPKPSNMVTIQGNNRILVTDAETGINYMVPSWTSRNGNLCFELNGILHFKTKSGYIGKRMNEKWVKATGLTTKATAQGVK